MPVLSLISPSSPKQLGMVSPELQKGRILDALVRITQGRWLPRANPERKTTMQSVLQYLVAPMVVVALQYLAQYFALPRIARKSKTAESILALKYQAMGEAVDVVERIACAASWSGPGVPDGHGPEGESPSQKEINLAYAKLMLVAVDPEIVLAFGKLTEGFSAKDRGIFLTKIRSELGLPSLGIPPEKVWYIFPKKKRAVTQPAS